MKKRIDFICCLMCLSALFASCSDDDLDRVYQQVQIVGVNIDNQLFIPTIEANGDTKVAVYPGTDLSNVKLQLLVANGTADLVENIEYDVRKPFDVKLKGFNGEDITTKLRIQSPPKFLVLYIDGLTIPQSDIYASDSALVVKVPEGTDLTHLVVTMDYSNGTFVNFENGTEIDYTTPLNYQILGVDDETIYNYELVITTEAIGPASIKSMKLNGVEADSIVVDANNVVYPYVSGLVDYTSVDVDLILSLGSKLEGAFDGTDLNLLESTNTVTVKGTNGTTTKFTIGIPQISATPEFMKGYSELVGFGSDNLISVAFSDQYVVAGNHSSAKKTPAYFDFSGNYINNLDTMPNMKIKGHGIRLMAADDKGHILGASLGLSGDAPVLFRWNSVTDIPQQYLSYDKSVIGESATPRLAGISITGDLDNNAIIVATKAKAADVFVWNVKNGVVDAKPQKYLFPFGDQSYYWNVNAMPIGMTGYIGFCSASDDSKSGVVLLNESMSEVSKITGFKTSGGSVIKIGNRTLVAYGVYSSKGLMRIYDVTDGKFQQIFNYSMKETGSNGNNTVSASLMIKDNNLYAVFACTGSGLYLYKIAIQ